jgi:D-tyrosyl-tRNA(Tyr) deacylase
LSAGRQAFDPKIAAIDKNKRMKVVIQRVLNASVTIHNVVHSAIDKGLMILLGIEDLDNEEDVRWLSQKITQLRIFNDRDGVMKLCVK